MKCSMKVYIEVPGNKLQSAEAQGLIACNIKSYDSDPLNKIQN